MNGPDAAPLTFGTAGLRGPMRPGAGGMNEEVVVRATAGLAAYLRSVEAPPGPVVVGRDARHGSERFARATAEVLTAAGLDVLAFDEPLPTPVTAFAVRDLDAAAGVQITASHNPAGDNGYKVYLRGGAQLVPPQDAEIEEAIRRAVPAAKVPRSPVPSAAGARLAPVVERYLRRAANVGASNSGASNSGASNSGASNSGASNSGASNSGASNDGSGGPAPGPLRIALTPMHGVGGATALEVLRRAGFPDVHVVAEQFAPDPDFPTAAFPNPEEPGATDLLLDLARRVDADVAIALDPDADRCALGIPDAEGAWRMLRGDETGTLYGEHLLGRLADRAAAGGTALVATTVVSSTLLGRIAAARGAAFRTTLTGFKWLVRAADDAEPGRRLVYAYEEALGLCVDPDAVRDKDGISAAVALCTMVARLRAEGRTVSGELDRIAEEFGVHTGRQVSVRVHDRAHLMRTLRADPPHSLAGIPVACADLLARNDGLSSDGLRNTCLSKTGLRTDALVLSGTGPPGDGFTVRTVIRPSGTEPKVKAYIEVSAPPSGDTAAMRHRAEAILDAAAAEIDGLLDAETA